jgi:selenocysteine-specific elongation factor
MIVATAGHVDHGKTLLVKALTGVDTDRLPEEKKRGLTIDLGFAYHDLGNGALTGFVDVPGHERFIRTMLAGVSGIDFVVFVVAADDGPMPQTAEHLAIMDQLEVSNGVIALTKIDRVSADRVAEVQNELSTLLDPTSLSKAPIIPVSAMTGEGVEHLKKTIFTAAEELPERTTEGNFRLAVDRSFLLAGAGRIVTGTVFSGAAKVGDQLMLAPAGVALRVREIHAQSQESENALAGQRCALNLVGGDLRRTEIHRGDWVVAEPACFGVSRFDARIRVLASEERPLKNRTSVHVHVGAADITGRVVTLEDTEIAPGNTGFVQIQLDRPISMIRGDRVIVRDQSALRTLGGGVALDPLPLTRGRSRDVRLSYMQAMDNAAPGAALSNILTHIETVSLDRFRQAWNMTDAEAEALWPTIEMKVIDDGRTQFGITYQRWNEIQSVIGTGLKAWHERLPDRVGVNENELRVNLGERIAQATFDSAIGTMLEDGKIVRDGGVVRLPEHGAVKSDADQELWAKVSRVLLDGGMRPPVVHDMLDSVGTTFPELSKFLAKTAREGQLVKISDKRYFMPQTVRELIHIVEVLVSGNSKGQFSVKDYRDRAGIGRNSVIEILEYFDRVGYTRRVEQVRQIRKPASEAFGALLS